MDEFSLIVSGIENKISRLILRNRQLHEKLMALEKEQRELLVHCKEKDERIAALEVSVEAARIAGQMKKGDASLTRQKINELLREIDKCQALLNR